MALRCDICGKGKTIGTSGAHKYGGKWAMRAIKTTKIWKPNLQNYTVDGKKMKLCTRCIKRIKFELKKKLAKKAFVRVEKPVEVKPIVGEKKPIGKKDTKKSTRKRLK
jgi:ribosomal protein L28